MGKKLDIKHRHDLTRAELDQRFLLEHPRTLPPDGFIAPTKILEPEVYRGARLRPLTKTALDARVAHRKWLAKRRRR